MNSKKKGFTLIELLVVMGMLAVLAVITVLVLRPAELFAQARDSTRLANLRAIQSALSYANLTSSLDKDGPNFPDDSCVGQANQRIFVSVPSSESPPTPPAGWTYQQVDSTQLKRIDGTGWLPVDFQSLITNFGTNIIAALPVDPVNTFSSGYYYSYVCGSYEVSAKFESEKYLAQALKDGGDEDGVMEVGSSVVIAPARPAAVVPQGPAPTVTSISPANGANTGSVSITSISGTNFVSGATVKLSKSGQPNINGTGFTVSNGTTISGGSFNLNGAVTGTWNLVVTNPDSQAGTFSSGFTVTGPVTPPTVSAINPTNGVNNGSVSLTSITGTLFASGATVKLTKSGQSDITCTGVTFSSATSLTGGSCNISGAAPGQWNVVVTNTDTGIGTLTNGFTVSAPAPTVSAITPSNRATGSVLTLTSVTGTNFSSGATVKLTKSGQSDISCSGVTFTNSTTLSGGSCNLSGVATGSWNVIVTNTDAQSGTLTNGFTVNAAPTVSAINPTSGVNSGSLSLTSITGTGFASGATVQLNKSGETDITCTGVAFSSATSLTGGSCPISGAAAGTWNVVVTNTNGGVGILSNGLTISAPAPTVSAINPTTGSNTGSVSLTSITGTNFASGATVKLTKSGQSDITCTGVTYSNTTTLTGGSCPISGAATGAWNVVVTANSQSGTLTNGFTVTAAAPTVSAINPTNGVNTGSVSLTSITGTNFASGATVKLTKSGQSDITCTGITFTNSTTLSGGSCPISGAVTGTWNVVVTNTDAQSGTLTNGFTVTDSISNGLVGYWNFNENTGTTAADSAGSNTGTLTGSPTWTTGHLGSGISFGTGKYVNVGNSSTLNPTTGMTISAWVRFTNFTGTQAENWIVGRDQSGGRSYAFGVDGAGNLTIQINGNAIPGPSGSLSTNTWYLITVTGDASSGWKIYRNNVQQGSAGTWVAPNSSATATNIGRRSYSGYEGYGNFIIDEVRIYNRALSASEVGTLYSSY